MDRYICRRKDMREHYLGYINADDETPIYEVEYGEYVSDKMKYATTIIHPGSVHDCRYGNECYMTKGHTHTKKNTPEIYTCISGVGILLMVNPLGGHIKADLLPGLTHVVPDGWFHRVINIGDSDLEFVAVYDPESGHNYGVKCPYHFVGGDWIVD